MVHVALHAPMGLTSRFWLSASRTCISSHIILCLVHRWDTCSSSFRKRTSSGVFRHSDTRLSSLGQRSAKAGFLSNRDSCGLCMSTTAPGVTKSQGIDERFRLWNRQARRLRGSTPVIDEEKSCRFVGSTRCRASSSGLECRVSCLEASLHRVSNERGLENA